MRILVTSTNLHVQIPMTYYMINSPINGLLINYSIIGRYYKMLILILLILYLLWIALSDDAVGYSYDIM